MADLDVNLKVRGRHRPRRQLGQLPHQQARREPRRRHQAVQRPGQEPGPPRRGGDPRRHRQADIGVPAAGRRVGQVVPAAWRQRGEPPSATPSPPSRRAAAGETFEKALLRQSRTILDASQGTATAVDALDLLGLTYMDVEGLSPDESFLVLADAIAGIEDPATRAAAAQEVFGRSGAELIPLPCPGFRWDQDADRLAERQRPHHDRGGDECGGLQRHDQQGQDRAARAGPAGIVGGTARSLEGGRVPDLGQPGGEGVQHRHRGPDGRGDRLQGRPVGSQRG